MIEELIENKVTSYETALHVIHDAYLGGHIEKWQKDDLVELAKKIGVSAGAISVPEHGRDYDFLFGKADEALYSVKQNGKHGVCIARGNKNDPGRPGGALSLDTDYEYYRQKTEGTDVHCVAGRLFKLYFTDEAACTESGMPLSAAEQNAADAAQLMPLAKELCLKGEFDSCISGDLRIYSVSLDMDRVSWAKDVYEQKYPWVQVNDPAGPASSYVGYYNIQSLPWAVFIKDGEIVRAQIGDQASLEKFIASQL